MDDIPSIVVGELVGPEAPRDGRPLRRSWVWRGHRIRLRIARKSKFSFTCSVAITSFPDGAEYQAEEQLRFVLLPRHFGGVQTRLECPNRACRKAVLALYVDDLSLRCRRCAKLVYPSQRQTAAVRRRKRLAEIKALLIAPNSGRLRRPPGMRKKRYQELKDEMSALQALVRADQLKTAKRFRAKAKRSLDALKRGERIRLSAGDVDKVEFAIDDAFQRDELDEFSWALREIADGREQEAEAGPE